MTKEKQQEVEEYITPMLSDMFAAAARYKPVELVGSSGSFDSFAQIILLPNNYNNSVIPKLVLNLFQYEVRNQF